MRLQKGSKMKCEHLDCGCNEKVWLPHILREDPCGMKSHPYCVHCGSIKNIGSDRAKGKGYFMNVLSNIDKHLRIPGSSVMMRLVAKELEGIEDFEDIYSMSKYAQERVFINIIRKYYQIPERTIEQFL